MPKEDKKLAAILAEMRGNEFDDPHLDADGIIGARRLARDWADRIEAAAKRERALLDANVNRVRELEAMLDGAANTVLGCAIKQKQSSPGNAAAMREALKESTAILAVVRGDEYEEDITRQIDRNTDALAAPARNCDRFATADDARRAFESAHSHGIVHNLYTAAFDWLFARAEGVKE